LLFGEEAGFTGQWRLLSAKTVCGPFWGGY
jgi:hypothetical protein